MVPPTCTKFLQSEVASAPGTEMYRQETCSAAIFPEQYLYNIELVLSHAQKTVDDAEYQQVLEAILPPRARTRMPPNLSPMSRTPISQQRSSQHLVFIASKPGISQTQMKLPKHLTTTSNSSSARCVFVPDVFSQADLLFWLAKILPSASKRWLQHRRTRDPPGPAGPGLCLGLLASRSAPAGCMCSVIMSLGVLYILAIFLQITSLSQNIVSMIGLGVGIDIRCCC